MEFEIEKINSKMETILSAIEEIEFINDDDEERIDETDTPINIPKRYLLNGMAQIEADSMIWFQTPYTTTISTVSTAADSTSAYIVP